MLVLRDNSRIILNVDSKGTGENLLDWLVGHVLDHSWLDDSLAGYRNSENTGRVIDPVQVELYTVAYYSRGRKGDVPDWIHTIPQ